MTRSAYVLITTLSAFAVSSSLFVPISPKLIWNASASAPVGLYVIQPDDHFEVPNC